MIADETDNCKRFEEGKERFVLKIASTKSTDFVKLVEAAMRVEKSLAEEKTEKEGNQGGNSAGQTSGTSREQFSRRED